MSDHDQPAPPPTLPASARSDQLRSRRRGSILLYSLFVMVLMLSLTSLAVDYGRMQMIKTQEQRNADLTALGTLQNYVSYNGEYGSNNATSLDSILTSNSYNPVDPNSGVAPTVTVVWGTWNVSSRVFTAGGSGTPLAVQVTVSRKAATGNPVALTFALFTGFSGLKATCDVSATATAYLTPTTITSQTVSAKANVWLAGMPAGSNASWSDNPSNAAPVFAVNVTPGSTINFAATGVTGYSGNNPSFPAAGAGYNTTHMQGSPDGNYNGLQNGIQTLTAPQNGLIGVFLTNAAPNTVTPPAAPLDYSTQPLQDRENNDNIATQQPFYIGNGQPSAGWINKSYVVPANATRLYLGVFDGWQNNDNPGSLTVTTTQQGQVSLVR